MRCAIYTRVSVDEKRLDSAGVLRGLKEDTSLKMQELTCRNYISQHAGQGYAVQDVYQDDGYSAKSLGRPALKRMIAAIDAGEVDAVVVYKIDRLTRSVADFYELAQSWFERELSFISASQSFNTGTVGGRLMLNILLTFAQFERELTSERTKDTRALRIMDGKFVGGEIPFGFQLKSPGQLEVSEPQAAIVRRIFEEAAEGRTPSEIAADLRSVNERRTSRKNPKGTPWNATVVRQFLENPRYRGVQYLGEKEYHQEHGCIVSSDLWNLANARLPEVTPVMRDAINSPFLLVGRGTCGICGQPLAAYEANGRSRKYAYYTCRRARKALGGKPCQLGNIRVDQLEHLIFEAIAVLGKHPALCRATAEAMLPEKSTSFLKHKKRLQEVDVRIDEIERSLPSVRELISSKARPALSERMRDEMEALLSEQNKLLDEKRLLVAKLSFENQRATNVSLVAEALGRMPKIFSALPATQRKELVGLLVQNVLVKPFDGESPGISGGALMITPQVGTKRLLVKISIYEKDLLSTAFTDSVDGSTLAEIGCPGRD